MSRMSRLSFARVADRRIEAFLQHAEQFGLEREGRVSDFIQEERPAIGHFEESLLGRTWRR